jgi:hypothetical protein
MSKLMQFCCAVLMLSFPLAALGAPADAGKHKPPRTTLNENDTPLDKMFDKAKKDIDDKVAARKLEEAKEGKTDCADADALPENDNEKPGKKAKACKVMQFKGNKIKDPPLELRDAHGNKVGKKVKTRMKLAFDNPQQRGVNRWDDLNELKYAGRPNLQFAGVAPGTQASNMRIRTVKLPGSEGINNDKDCIDTASGVRHGGYVLDEQGNKIWNPDSCFDETGALKKTLTLVEGGTGECAHANGKVYSAEECQELNLTTLEELIDEDSPKEAGGPPVDGDQDGNVDDVPELGTANSPCMQHGGVPVVGSNGESCDFTQAVRKKLNQDALAQLPPGKQKKLFKINDTTGECDSSADGEYECGQEPREVELEETMELSCPPGGIMEEDRCLIPPPGQDGALAALAVRTSSEGTATVADYAMMGFTFAPPVLKWGIFEVDRACIFGFCFEIFALKFGYEFELAAGLRLPVKVTVTDIPSPQVAVEQERTMTASLEAVDFKVSDFTAFCQKHNLDRSWWISDCNRFAFPEYFEAMLPDWMFSSPGDRQGSEFVLQNTTFAGLVIRVFSIPVVNYAIDASVNVPAMCTLYKMKQQIADGGAADWIRLAATFGQNLQDSKDFMASLEGTLTNCASFTTPWGYDANNEPRQFPFLTGSFAIPADCTREIIENAAVKVGGESKPMCTGLKVTIYGATLGLGLELVPQAYSDLIKAKATTGGDAQALEQTLRFHWGEGNPSIGPVRFDNYDATNPPPAGDKAFINLDEFTYYLNRFGVQVNGLIELGGLLAFIGNVATVPLVNLTFDLDDYGIPIPQHPGTGPVSIEVPVVNYALTVDAKPRPDDPMRVSDDVLRVKPGPTPGVFEVWVKNEGSVPDTMDTFTVALSNRPQSTGPYVFGIYPNTDFDCVDSSGKLYWGYPFDTIADNCYDASGKVRTDRTEVTADDSIGVWAASLGATSVPNLPAHSVATTPVTLTVTPYRHPLTKPGDYPIRITADSRGARDLKLAAVDPSNVPRLGAEDVVLMRIESFFEPQVTVTPMKASVKPRGSVIYTVEGTNYGNDLDQFTMQAAFADSDTVPCSLTDNGGPGCPFRAQITRIDLAGWTTVARELATLFPATGNFEPLGSAQDTFTIRAPLDWAGMENTTYEFTLTATSKNDPAISKAKNEKTASFTVLATKESMSRYVNLEVAEFLEQINLADAQGIAMRGIQPVMVHPVGMMTTKALEQILAGDLGGASKTLASAIKVMEAVDRMVNGAGLPDQIATDWKARSAAILNDMAFAQASTEASQ